MPKRQKQIDDRLALVAWIASRIPPAPGEAPWTRPVVCRVVASTLALDETEVWARAERLAVIDFDFRERWERIAPGLS